MKRLLPSYTVVWLCMVALSCSPAQSKEDAEIEMNVEHRMQYLVKLYGSKEKLEQTLGKTYLQIANEYRAGISPIIKKK